MKTINKILALCIVFLTISCDDIIEKDIANETVQTISPINDAEISSNVVAFQWNTVKGAKDYRIQVYSDNRAIVLDTLIGKANFTAPLNIGRYQWRVRAENPAYQSAYSFPINFRLIPNSDLTNQQVILTTPNENAYSKSTSLTCNWTAISTASTYTFQLENVTSGTFVETPDITSNSFVLTNTAIASDAEYKWKVKALNTSNTTSTVYSSRTLYIDRIKPNQPVNVLPAPTPVQIANQAINFTWSMAPDTGIIKSPISYKIEFSTSTDFTVNLQTQTNVTIPLSKTFTTAGIYYWRVTATDGAGNEGLPSTATLVTIQ
jgi:hypothetical protein